MRTFLFVSAVVMGTMRCFAQSSAAPGMEEAILATTLVSRVVVIQSTNASTNAPPIATRPCPQCKSSGRVACWGCRGGGIATCAKCNGAKFGADKPAKTPCKGCNGSGYQQTSSGVWPYHHQVVCPNCHGSKYFESSEKTYCDACNGRGVAKCPLCQGFRALKCTACKGTGLVP